MCACFRTETKDETFCVLLFSISVRMNAYILAITYIYTKKCDGDVLIRMCCCYFIWLCVRADWMSVIYKNHHVFVGKFISQMVFLSNLMYYCCLLWWWLNWIPGVLFYSSVYTKVSLEWIEPIHLSTVFRSRNTSLANFLFSVKYLKDKNSLIQNLEQQKSYTPSKWNGEVPNRISMKQNNRNGKFVRRWTNRLRKFTLCRNDIKSWPFWCDVPCVCGILDIIIL